LDSGDAQNVSPNGAAITISGTRGNSTINSSLFRNNSVSSTGSGGAISIRGNKDTTTTVINSTFDQNYGPLGGSIYMNTGTTLLMADSEFISSDASFGGSVFLSDDVTAIIVNTTFTNCRASVSGGALVVSNSTYTVLTQVKTIHILFITSFATIVTHAMQKVQ
jgi:hypothetical protein